MLLSTTANLFSESKWDQTLKLLKDRKTRVEGTKQLEQMGSDIVPDLKKAAFDATEEEYVRAAAIGKLGRLKAIEYREKIEECLLSDKSRMCRITASVSLGLIGNVKSIPVLKKAMQEDSSETSRMYAALALAKMGDYSGKEPAMEMLASSNINGQIVAVEILGVIGDKKLLPRLKTHLKDTNDEWKQLNTKEAIYSIEMKSLRGQELLEYLKNILYKDEFYMLHQWVAEKIANLKTPEAIKVLKSIASDKKAKGAHAAWKQLMVENKAKENK